MAELRRFPRAPRWMNGKVFSLHLRNGDYALFQMLQRKGEIAVFKHFRSVDRWDGLSLDTSSVLFFAFALTAFFRRSTIRCVQDVVTVANLEYPPPHVPRIDTGDFRKMTFWPGTPNERTVITRGSGDNSLISRTRKGHEILEHVTPISASDYDKYADTELTGLTDYPNLNERILLCRLLGRNFDPDKEIAFDHPLPIECATYIDIIGGKVRLSELGY